MAYGDENLTLKNFDEYTEEDVFEEVTGITLDNFRLLRDGGYYLNEESGAEEYFKGHLFDETVFNDSIKEFWKKNKNLPIILTRIRTRIFLTTFRRRKPTKFLHRAV